MSDERNDKNHNRFAEHDGGHEVAGRNVGKTGDYVYQRRRRERKAGKQENGAETMPIHPIHRFVHLWMAGKEV
ncbi:hypothetical protein D1872_187300 [compost metagenome]